MFVFNEDKYAHKREILKEQRTLDRYMMNILNNVTYIYARTRQ